MAYANNALGGASGVITEKGATAAMAAQAKRLNRASTAITALLDVKGIVDATQNKRSSIGASPNCSPPERVDVCPIEACGRAKSAETGDRLALEDEPSCDHGEGRDEYELGDLAGPRGVKTWSLGVVEPMPPVT